MCGITGWVGYSRDLRQERRTIDAMTETMACRGPDASGVWADRNAALGHRRLAVIDLPGGLSPCRVHAERRVVMVYSGEAYNFTELREELTQGHRFTTSSDTEVVLRGYLQWGEAFADGSTACTPSPSGTRASSKLVMVRDRMGIKPFYYYPTADGVLFGSEPKAILANPLAERVVDLDGLRELLAFVKTPGARGLEGHARGRAGHHRHGRPSGHPGSARYWPLEPREHTDDQDTTVAHVRELLEDIVRRQLVADVPLCTLLSGGLDSSAITALAARRDQRDRCARSPSTSSARPRTSNPTTCATRRTRRTCTTWRATSATGHTDIVLDPTSSPTRPCGRKVVAGP